MTNNEQFYKDGCLKLINAIYAMAKTLNSEAVCGLDKSMRDAQWLRYCVRLWNTPEK